MIQIDTANYNTTVRVWNDDRGILIDLAPSLCDRGPVGRRDVVNLLASINLALVQLQARESSG